ncbi:hypothetical protein CHUAL_002847 [Chamberlinius hualienensis]
MDDNQFSSELDSKIESLKKLLEEDSSLNITAGEYLLLTSLHTCNGDVERTKEKIIKYFQYKKQFPKLLKAVDLLDDYRQSMYRKCILITDANQEQLKSPFVMVIDMSNGSGDCLKDEIPSESLPIEYGGTNGTAEECNDHLLPTMTKWRDVILNQF